MQENKKELKIVYRYILPIRALSYNQYYRIYRNKYVISPRGREFRDVVKMYLNAIPDIKCHNKKIKMLIDFFLVSKRETDTDNNLKSIIDSCKGILYDDDNLIYEIHCRKFIDCDKNEIHIEIEELKE